MLPKEIKMIKNIVLPVCFFLGFLFISCENKISDPGNSDHSVLFRLGKGHSNPGIRLLNKGLKSRKINPYQILKTSGFDELRLICLDMTRWNDVTTFFEYWQTSAQGQSLIDMALWDSTKDVWDNYVLLLKKYPGDAFDFIGDYSFSISDSTAKGTVYLNPGLNYFIYALRKGGKTGGYPGETWSIIQKDTDNVINLQYTNTAPDYPSNPNPQDYQTGVSLSPLLQWACTDPDFDPITYDVYLGTDYGPPLVKPNITTAAYVPTQLLPNTTYYWYIVARDDHGNETTGVTWQFTTGQQ
jgi:hypothetical protein